MHAFFFPADIQNNYLYYEGLSVLEHTLLKIVTSRVAFLFEFQVSAYIAYVGAYIAYVHSLVHIYFTLEPYKGPLV